MEIYTIAKSLRRNEKPDYQKLIKKVLMILNTYQKKHNKVNPDPALKKRTAEIKSRTSGGINDKSIKLHIDREQEKSNKAKAKTGSQEQGMPSPISKTLKENYP